MAIKRQRGFLGWEALISYGVWVVAITATLTLLLPRAMAFREAMQIDHTLRQLQEQSQAYYDQQVLTTRCLPQTALSLSDLPPLTDDGLAHYQVGYRQGRTANAPPMGIEVTVTVLHAPSLSTVAAYTDPERLLPPQSLRFFTPLKGDLPDWAGWNTNTGCLL
ncbi:hypothetical protein AB4427_09710 [Vibrio artabrorum]|uniref:hypothetical protein n=1 Tax=Vibrio artabrorum TaxID=446374 RepID=UPI0035527FBF